MAPCLRPCLAFVLLHFTLSGFGLELGLGAGAGARRQTPLGKLHFMLPHPHHPCVFVFALAVKIIIIKTKSERTNAALAPRLEVPEEEMSTFASQVHLLRSRVEEKTLLSPATCLSA